MAPQNSDPQHVDISLSQGVKITWGDGHESQYALEYLRQRCPCATCRTEAQSAKTTPPGQTKPAANAFPMFKPTTRLTNAKTVGRYAVQLFWSDGHNTGIYSFDHLRDICPCAECGENKD